MKGTSPNAQEKIYWDLLARVIGCIACRHDGVFNDYVSIHHVNGRTRPGCHKDVLPLCAQHHQHDDTDPAGRTGVHPFKTRFEQKYGDSMTLNGECNRILTEQGYTVGWL